MFLMVVFDLKLNKTCRHYQKFEFRLLSLEVSGTDGSQETLKLLFHRL